MFVYNFLTDRKTKTKYTNIGIWDLFIVSFAPLLPRKNQHDSSLDAYSSHHSTHHLSSVKITEMPLVVVLKFSLGMGMFFYTEVEEGLNVFLILEFFILYLHG